MKYLLIIIVLIIWGCSGSGSEIGNPLDIDTIIPLDTVRIMP